MVSAGGCRPPETGADADLVETGNKAPPDVAPERAVTAAPENGAQPVKEIEMGILEHPTFEVLPPFKKLDMKASKDIELDIDGIVYNESDLYLLDIMPIGNDILILLGTDENEEEGFLLQRRNGRWSSHAAWDYTYPEHIYATSLDDIWITAGGDIMHFDGDKWIGIRLDRGELYDIWSDGHGNAYAVGHYFIQIRKEGDQFSIMTMLPKEYLDEVWGSSAQDVYAGGTNGYLMHYDGESWTDTSFGNSLQQSVWAIHGTPDGKVWVTTRDGHLRVKTGGEWQESEYKPKIPLYDLLATESGVLFAGGKRGLYRIVDGKRVKELSVDSEISTVRSMGENGLLLMKRGNLLILRGDELQKVSWRDFIVNDVM